MGENFGLVQTHRRSTGYGIPNAPLTSSDPHRRDAPRRCEGSNLAWDLEVQPHCVGVAIALISEHPQIGGGSLSRTNLTILLLHVPHLGAADNGGVLPEDQVALLKTETKDLAVSSANHGTHSGARIKEEKKEVKKEEEGGSILEEIRIHKYVCI